MTPLRAGIYGRNPENDPITAPPITSQRQSRAPWARAKQMAVQAAKGVTAVYIAESESEPSLPHEALVK